MTARLARIKKRKDFLRLSRTRRKWATAGLVLQAAESISPPLSGTEDVLPSSIIFVGFTCSKKVGNAVQRNRAKRRLRALADEILPQRAKAAHDYVLIGRKETILRPYALLRRDLLFALERVDALEKTSLDASQKQV